MRTNVLFTLEIEHMFVYNEIVLGRVIMYDYHLLEDRDVLCIDQKSFLRVYLV